MTTPEQKFWSWKNSQGDFNIHYIEKGAGDSHVILLHGFAANTYTWRNTIDPLVNAGYHVWAIDLLGFGASDKPLNAPYGLDLYIDQLEAFIKAKAIDKAHLIGNSMGGGIFLELTLKFPDFVRSLTLVNAMGHPMNLPVFLKFARWSPEMAKPLLSRTVIKTALRDLIVKKESLSEAQVDAYWIPLSQQGGKEAFLKLLQMFDNELMEKMVPTFHRIAVPTLIIWGDRDSLIPVSHAELFHEEIKDSKLLIIKDCGHIPQEEEPQIFNTNILAFLKSQQ